MLKTRPITANTGVVNVHSSSPLKDLIQDSSKSNNENRKVHKSLKTHIQRSKSAGCIEGSGKRLSRDFVQFPFKGWLSENSARKVQEKTDFESSSMSNLYNTLLENEYDLSEDVDGMLIENELLQRRKKVLLLRDWTDRVYKPLKAEIDDEMNGKQYKKYDRVKRDLYRKYLRYTNEKGNVFLDTISFDEYDPMSINAQRPGPLKVAVRRPHDPLLFQAEKRNEEERRILHCETGLKLTDDEIEKIRLPPLPLVPLGRHGTEWGDLLAMGLNVVGSETRSRRQRILPETGNKESLDFEVWKKTPVHVGLIDKELRTQRKKQFAEKYRTTLAFS